MISNVINSMRFHIVFCTETVVSPWNWT